MLPQYAWKNSGAVVNGKVYLLPIQQYRVGPIMFNNSGIWDSEIGPNYAPKDADDFKRVLLQLDPPQENRWAIGGPPQQVTGIQFAFGPIAQLFGAPNGWQLGADGKLVRDRETEAYKAAVGYVRDLYAAGVYDPDQPTYNVSIARNNYLASKLVVVQESFGGGWTDLWLRGRSQNPPAKFNFMVPFAAQAGVKPTHFMTPGFLLANGFRKASPDKIEELLRVCNWLAAPFGTQEDLLVQYGVEGTDYTLDAAGNPVPTSVGPANSLYVGWQFIVAPPVGAVLPRSAGLRQGQPAGAAGAAGVRRGRSHLGHVLADLPQQRPQHGDHVWRWRQRHHYRPAPDAGLRPAGEGLADRRRRRPSARSTRTSSRRPDSAWPASSPTQPAHRGSELLRPYRVLDLTNELGELAGRILADLGADVIKVEPPDGDPSRWRPPFFGDRPDPRGQPALVGLQPQQTQHHAGPGSAAEGQDLFRRLVQTADFVLESFPPGYLDGLGLGYAALAEINPRVILTSITPFGQTGPYASFRPRI